MPITASPMLLLVGAGLLSAAAYLPLPADRWASKDAPRMLGSDVERIGWSLLSNVWLVGLLLAFWHYREVRGVVTGGLGLVPPWRYYLTVVVLALAIFALRWVWASLLRRLLEEPLALRAIERWRVSRHASDGDTP